MVSLIPFKGVRYNTKEVTPESVIVPPYDVFGDKELQEFINRSEYNFARVIKAAEPQQARENLEAWLKKGILVEGDKPVFYVYEQGFEIRDVNGEAVRKKRTAIIALVQLEEFEKKIVLDHEKTFQKTVNARLELIKSIKTNTGQIFGIYSDGKGIHQLVREAETEPILEFEDEFGISHKLVSITNAITIESIIKSLEDAQVLIADGHHRYESTLKYRNFMRDNFPNYDGNEPWNYVMMSLVSEDDEGLVIFPMNRLVKNLSETDIASLTPKIEKYFEIASSGTREQMLKDMRKSKSEGQHVFGIYSQKDNKYFMLRLKKRPGEFDELKDVVPELRRTDVRILHTLLLNHVFGITEKMISDNEDRYVKYAKGDDDTLKLTETKEYSFAVYLNPVSLRETRDVSNAGYVMERKTTCFYPKVYSGLVMFSHATERGK